MTCKKPDIVIMKDIASDDEIIVKTNDATIIDKMLDRYNEYEMLHTCFGDIKYKEKMNKIIDILYIITEKSDKLKGKFIDGIP